MPTPQCFYGSEPIFFGGSLRTTPALPKTISERGDFLLVGCVSAMFRAGSPMLLFLQVSLIGVLKRLPGTFVPGEVIFLPVVLGAGEMCMCGTPTVLGSYLL
jgi:hypothetical protein